jgi:WD40 repeat protein
VKTEVRQLANLPGHQGAVYALESGEQDGTCFSAGADKLITSWDLHTCTNLPFLARLPDPVYSLCYVREKNILLAGTSTGAIHIIDLLRKEEVKILRHHTAQIFDIRYSLKQNTFYTAGGDGVLGVCSLDTFSATRILKLSTAKVRQLDLSSDEEELAVACGDGNILLLEAGTGKEKFRFSAHQFSANAVRYHPNGLTLLSGGKDAYLRVWDRQHSFAELAAIPAHNFAIYQIAFQPEGKLFATASRDKTIKLWDASDYRFLLRIDKDNYAGHVNSVNTLLWKERLVSAGDDRSLLVWDVEA